VFPQHHQVLGSTKVFFGFENAFLMLIYRLQRLASRVAYPIWSGLGIVRITFASCFVYGVKCGFKRVKTEPCQGFGHDLVGETCDPKL